MCCTLFFSVETAGKISLVTTSIKGDSIVTFTNPVPTILTTHRIDSQMSGSSHAQYPGLLS